MSGALLSAAVGLLTGILSGFGIGGGSLLMLYLTMVVGLDQQTAGGINLLYFLVCAPAALLSHLRNHLIDRRAALFCIVSGIPAAVTGALFSTHIDLSLLHRGFGILLIFIGLKEIFVKKEK